MAILYPHDMAVINEKEQGVQQIGSDDVVEPVSFENLLQDSGDVAWSSVVDDDGNKPEDDADVTANNTSADTTLVNGVAAATISDRSQKLLKEILWKGRDNDGLTETTSNCTITRKPIQTTFATTTAAAANGNLDLDTGLDTLGGWSVTDWGFVVPVEKGGETDNDTFIGLTDDVAGWASVPASATSTDKHIGFFLQENGVGATTLTASNANGTTQTSTVITGIDLTSRHTYLFVYDVGTDIKFYVDDVLKATHTTNLPTSTSSGGGGIQFFMGIKNTSTVASNLTVYNNYLLFIVL